MAARAAAIPNANPGGVPYVLPLPPLGPYGALDPVTDALANPLNQPGAFTPYAAPAGPIGARANLAALGLNVAGAQPGAVPPAAAAAGMDAWQLAMQNAQLGANYIQNSNYVAGKANEFREVAVIRLREIYGRLLSIGDRVAIIGPAANAAAQAQSALVALIDAVNAQGYINPQQAQAMADLAEQLQGVDIPLMMAGLQGEINAIAQAVGVLNLNNRNAGDIGPIPLQGGRRKKKAKKTRRKKHKGGYKFTRAAISRRSLRQSRRKSLRHKKHHKKHNKKHNKKHKRTKKRRRRKRR